MVDRDDARVERPRDVRLGRFSRPREGREGLGGGVFNWRNRSVDVAGSVLFRGSLPPRVDDFVALERCGATVERLEGDANAHWGLRCRDDAWGDAYIVCSAPS